MGGTLVTFYCSLTFLMWIRHPLEKKNQYKGLVRVPLLSRISNNEVYSQL